VLDPEAPIPDPEYCPLALPEPSPELGDVEPMPLEPGVEVELCPADPMPELEWEPALCPLLEVELLCPELSPEDPAAPGFVLLDPLELPGVVVVCE
jgi:hypothetical protein